MLKKYPNLLLFCTCFALAFLGHGVFLYQWLRDHFMVGINDGLSQMMPFKHLLYEQYTNGEFFYSFDFGLGAGTFSELSYYFSTSIVFLISVVFVFILETVGIVNDPNVLFWANTAVFISIVRLAAVLYITARLFMYMNISRLHAILGASFYGIAGMYFRHAVYWEFFADAFLWLPLLILGIEKVFREQKPGWFLLAVSISLIDNFYFSYINFLLAGIFILFRLFIPLSFEETRKKKAITLFLASGIIGFGISAVSFIPAVYAYLNNHRPPFQLDIPLIDFTDNILFDSRFIILPAIFILLLFTATLYRNNTFRLFALLGITGIVMHHSPLVGSVFNGFSAPQYRWEYFLTFAMGGTIAVGLGQLQKISLRSFGVSAALSAAILILFAFLAEEFELFTLTSYVAISGFLVSSALVFGAVKTGKAIFKTSLICCLFVWILASANIYQVEKLLEDGDIWQISEELITGSEYDDPEIRGLLEEIQARDNGDTYRIEWMEGVRNNTPIVQDFRGLSAYSSILNENLLHFYLYDLEIDMARESVSRYATLGKRVNLHSLLQGKYTILPKNDKNVPFGFTEILASENYAVYQNGNVLPFARSTSTVYKEDQLKKSPPLVREHAMLSGIILDGAQQSQQLPKAEDQIDDFSIEEIGSSYEDGVLEVKNENGGIDLVKNTPFSAEGDFYVSFHLENQAFDQGFDLEVNDYHTTRKSNQSVYKTFVDDITIRIPAGDRIEIRVPEGIYELTELQIYEETYELLKAQSREETKTANLEISGSRVELDYSNSANDEYLSFNVPFERGWSAKVNGKKTEVLKANYAFTAVPIENGDNEITLSYQPPFFKLSLIMSILSLLTGIIWIFKRPKS